MSLHSPKKSGMNYDDAMEISWQVLYAYEVQMYAHVYMRSTSPIQR